MKNILITGAAGFIGSQLAYRLWKQGCRPVLLDNFSYGREDNLVFPDKDFRGDVLRADIRDRARLDAVFADGRFDCVYHVAAVTVLPDCQTNPGEAVEVNVAGTVNVLEAARRHGAEKVLFASTSAVYENNTVFPTREEDPVRPSLVYSATKYAAEQFCRSYADVYGMNVTVLRFANVYGPHIDCLRKQPPVAGYIIRELYYGRSPELHSDGEQRRDFVYVDDLIDLALLAQNGTGYDCVNVSTGETHSVNELCNTIAKIMGKEQYTPRYRNSSNYWLGYPALYEGAYKINMKILENEVNKFTQCSTDHAREKYGWSNRTGWEEGLRRTVEFSVSELKKAECKQ